MQDRLVKTTLNLFEDDVEFFKQRFGYGWSTDLRRIMRREVQTLKKVDEVSRIIINEDAE